MGRVDRLLWPAGHAGYESYPTTVHIDAGPPRFRDSSDGNQDRAESVLNKRRAGTEHAHCLFVHHISARSSYLGREIEPPARNRSSVGVADPGADRLPRSRRVCAVCGLSAVFGPSAVWRHAALGRARRGWDVASSRSGPRSRRASQSRRRAANRSTDQRGCRPGGADPSVAGRKPGLPRTGPGSSGGHHTGISARIDGTGSAVCVPHQHVGADPLPA
jgi:hypothetical protein